MAFDSNNTGDLLALQSEFNNDPVSMGYAATNGGTNQILSLFNDPGKNVGGETATITLTTGALLSAIVPSDFDHAQVSDGKRRYIEAFLGRPFSENIEPWRAQIREAFRTNSTTVTNLDAMVRPLSRAEVLFGEGTVISRNDWIAARDYQA